MQDLPLAKSARTFLKTVSRKQDCLSDNFVTVPISRLESVWINSSFVAGHSIPFSLSQFFLCNCPKQTVKSLFFSCDRFLSLIQVLCFSIFNFFQQWWILAFLRNLGSTMSSRLIYPLSSRVLEVRRFKSISCWLGGGGFDWAYSQKSTFLTNLKKFQSFS